VEGGRSNIQKRKERKRKIKEKEKGREEAKKSIIRVCGAEIQL
jgi:hypothetical protein